MVSRQLYGTYHLGCQRDLYQEPLCCVISGCILRQTTMFYFELRYLHEICFYVWRANTSDDNIMLRSAYHRPQSCSNNVPGKCLFHSLISLASHAIALLNVGLYLRLYNCNTIAFITVWTWLNLVNTSLFFLTRYPNNFIWVEVWHNWFRYWHNLFK